MKKLVCYVSLILLSAFCTAKTFASDDDDAHAAYAFASKAKPNVPAPSIEEQYLAARDSAVKNFQPFVVFVGRDASPVDGAIVFRCNTKVDCKKGDILIGAPNDGEIYWIDKVRDPASIKLPKKGMVNCSTGKCTPSYFAAVSNPSCNSPSCKAGACQNCSCTDGCLASTPAAIQVFSGGGCSTGNCPQSAPVSSSGGCASGNCPQSAPSRSGLRLFR